MPLPSTNLTLHLDASDTDKLFTTWVNGGSHTGTPADGNAVQAWARETDGSVTPANAAYYSGTGNSPAWRTTTPLMLLPCLDFDGTDDAMVLVNNDNVTSYHGSSNFFSTTARAILIAFRAESITTTNSTAATAEDNHGLFCGSSHWRISLRNDGGQRKLQATAYDGAWKMAEVNVSENTDHVAVIRHDGTNLYVSVDGGAESSTACGTIASDSAQVFIGRNANAVVYNGRIGEIATYNTGGFPTDANAYFRERWQGVGGGGGPPTGGLTRPVLIEGRLVA